MRQPVEDDRMEKTTTDQHLTNFDLFVLGVSVLSLLNILLIFAPFSDPVTNVVFIFDGVLCLIFLGDFLLRLKRAPEKRTYLIQGKGWLDFLGSLPFPGLRVARIFRVILIGRMAGHYGVRGMWRTFTQDRAGSALLGTLFLAILILQFGSMAVLGAEADKEGTNIKTASDALWWSYATVTTVGYGDRFPVTNQGRLVGVAMLTIGIGLFGVLTGFVTNTLLAPRQAKPDRHTEDSGDIRVEIEELKRLVRELSEQAASQDRHERGVPEDD
jgi:voltage-gated potassium channel